MYKENGDMISRVHSAINTVEATRHTRVTGGTWVKNKSTCSIFRPFTVLQRKSSHEELDYSHESTCSRLYTGTPADQGDISTYVESATEYSQKMAWEMETPLLVVATLNNRASATTTKVSGKRSRGRCNMSLQRKIKSHPASPSLT